MLPTLTLSEYRSLVVTLPPPTDQQKDNFSKFVSQAHSWYKHLPLCLPGVKFHFFIDSSAGCERAVTFTGKIKLTPRAKQGFHYSWIPTNEYRRNFGYLRIPATLELNPPKLNGTRLSDPATM